MGPEGVLDACRILGAGREPPARLAKLPSSRSAAQSCIVVLDLAGRVWHLIDTPVNDRSTNALI